MDILESFSLVREFPAKGYPATGFPARAEGGFVYIVCWVSNGKEAPLYVGQTSRLNERMNDHCVKQFGAATDFRVGEAICYVRDVRGYQIVVRYRPSAEPKRDEYVTLRKLQMSGVRLLNDLVSYNYRQADKQEEREAIHKFCEVLLRFVAEGSSL